MTGRKKALQDLLTKVEAGEANGKFGPIMRAHWNFDLQFDAMKAHHGSLDAAKALHEAVLPEWAWCVDRLGQAMVWYPFVEGDALSHESGDIYALKYNPARGWLIAILKALIVQEDKP